MILAKKTGFVVKAVMGDMELYARECKDTEKYKFMFTRDENLALFSESNETTLSTALRMLEVYVKLYAECFDNVSINIVPAVMEYTILPCKTEIKT